MAFTVCLCKYVFLIFGAVKGFDSLYVIVNVLSKVLTLCVFVYMFSIYFCQRF